MVTQLEDVSNQVSQQKIGNQRLRNEAIRKGLEQNWTAPQETEQTTNGTTPTTLTDVTSNTGTLANTYSNLLNNSKSLGLDTLGTSNTNNTTSGSMPNWLPPVAGKGVGILSGNNLYGTLANMALSGASGNWTGAASQGVGTLASLLGGNKIPGIGGIAGTLASGLLGEKSKEDISMDLGNSLLGTGLSMANPLLGTAYGLAKLFGLDVARGAIDYTKSDISQRFDAGYNGGWFGGGSGNRGSWNATNGTVGTNNTYSGSGGGNKAGPGSGGLSSDNATNSTSDSTSYSNPASSYGGW